MDSQLEKISAVECRVRVEIPWATVSPRLTAKFRDLQRKAQLPGFRRGKVPPQIIERMYGKGVRDELAQDLVNETFQEAIGTHKKVPLNNPIRESFELAKGKPFSYTVRFEVVPEIEPTDYEGVPVRRRPAVLDNEKVEKIIREKQEEHAELAPIEEGREQTQDGDVWTVDVEGTLGEHNISRKDLKVELGAAGDQEFLPGFTAALAQVPVSALGTTREIVFTPTSERMRPELRDVAATLNVGLRDLRHKNLPGLDDDFAKDIGETETFAEYRASLEKQTLEEDQEQAEMEARQRLVTELLNRNKFDVAPSMITREVSAQVNMYKQQLAQQGLTLAQLGMNEAAVTQQMQPRARYNVTAFLLLDAIGKKQEITVDDESLNAELAELAAERGENIDRMRAQMEKNQQILLLRAQLREAKILDFLMEKSDVTEAPDPVEEEAQEHVHDENCDHDHDGHDHD